MAEVGDYSLDPLAEHSEIIETLSQISVLHVSELAIDITRKGECIQVLAGSVKSDIDDDSGYERTLIILGVGPFVRIQLADVGSTYLSKLYRSYRPEHPNAADARIDHLLCLMLKSARYSQSTSKIELAKVQLDFSR